MPQPLKHILVIRLSAMGDVAMTVPVLKALTQQYPDLKITVLTRALFKPFFRDLSNVTVFIADVKGKHKGVLGLYNLAKTLNTENNFYAIADLHNVLRSTILKLFLKRKVLKTINKGRSEKKALVSGKAFKQLKTTHERYADVFKALGLSINLTNPSFPEKINLNEKLKRYFSIESKCHIGVAPFTAHKGKMYPLDLMKQVIEVLSKKYRIILFGGGQSEIALLNEFETAFNNVVSVAGKLTLDEELDVISNLDVMLSMDSSNAHLAAMLGVKVLSIWGVTHPYAGFTPFNQPNDFSLLSNRKQYPLIPTSIYGNKYPDVYEEVSRSISPQKIIDKIETVI